MRIISADWIFPTDGAPIQNGSILFHGDAVLQIGPREQVKRSVDNAAEVNFPDMALAPGLINCHTHLELSPFDRLPVREGFAGWVRDLLEKKSKLTEEEILDRAERGALELHLLGTAYVADVASSGLTVIALLKAGLPGTVFREFLGFGPEALETFERALDLYDPEGEGGITLLPSCHAPFSTSRDLFEAVGNWSRSKDRPTQVHLAESKAEVDLLLKGKGELKELLLARGIPKDQIPYPKMGPIAYLDAMGFLDERTIAVHLVQVKKKEIDLLAERGVKPCLCPSSNLHLTGTLPPVEKMLAAGLEPCLGTDSTASGVSLNLFKEMVTLMDAGVSAKAVFRMGTVNGQKALKLSEDYGRLEAGIRPTLLALPCQMECDRDPMETALRKGAEGWVRWVLPPGGGGVIHTEDAEWEGAIP